MSQCPRTWARGVADEDMEEADGCVSHLVVVLRKGFEEACGKGEKNEGRPRISSSREEKKGTARAAPQLGDSIRRFWGERAQDTSVDRGREKGEDMEGVGIGCGG